MALGPLATAVSTPQGYAEGSVLLLVGPGALPDAIADSLEAAGREAERPIARIDVASADDLLDRLARSRHELVLVVAHGERDGIRFHQSTATPESLAQAIGRSGSVFVRFLACDLQLPPEIGGADVHTEASSVDARVAEIRALEAWSQLYADGATLDRFLGIIQDRFEALGGPQGFVIRSIEPREPLRVTPAEDGAGQPDPYNFDCYSRDPPADAGCNEHDYREEDEAHKQAEATIQVTSTSGTPFDQGIQYLRDVGLLSLAYDHYEHGRNWDFLMSFDFFKFANNGCIPVVGLQDIAVPGYTLARLKYDLASGKVSGAAKIGMDAELLRLKLCGSLFIGKPTGGGVGGGGQIAAQIGTEINVEVKIGRGPFSINLKFGMGAFLVLTVTATGRYIHEDGAPKLIIDLSFEVDFIIDGNLGFKIGGFKADLWGPKSTSYTIDLSRFSSSAAPVGEDRANVLALTAAHLRGVASDPATRAAFTSAAGVDPLDVPPGSVVDLSHPAFHDLFVGPEMPRLKTQLSLPDGILLGNYVLPSLGSFKATDIEGCGGRLNLGLLHECAPARSTASGDDPTCARPAAERAYAIVCVDTAGSAPGGSAEVFVPRRDINGTVSPLLEQAFHTIDPICANNLGPLYEPGSKQECPYTYPANLCGWTANEGMRKIGRPPSESLDKLCSHYRYAAAGEGVFGDQKYYFEIATGLPTIKKHAGQLVSDLCRGLTSVATASTCPGTVFFDQTTDIGSSPLDGSVLGPAEHLNHVASNYYDGADVFDMVQCHGYRWARYTLTFTPYEHQNCLA